MKIVKVIKYVFLTIGLLILAGSFYLFTNTQNFLKTAQTTSGTVTELIRSKSSNSSSNTASYTYKPVVEFRTQENERIEFTSSTGSNPASYSRGEEVDVLYSATSPETARINAFFSLWGGVVITGVLGSVFFLIGFLTIFLTRQKIKKIDDLKQTGSPITAKFQRVKLNSSYEINGRNPYQILAQWKNPMTSEIYVFKSENIWFDPTDHIKGDEITVLIDRNNPKKYHVDTSFLPKIAD